MTGLPAAAGKWQECCGAEHERPVTGGQTGDSGYSAQAGTDVVTGAPEISRLFGTNLRAARMRAGMTQEDLSRVTKMSRTFITAVEGGKKNITFDTAASLAAAVGSTVRDLLRPSSTSPRGPRSE